MHSLIDLIHFLADLCAAAGSAQHFSKERAAWQPLSHRGRPAGGLHRSECPLESDRCPGTYVLLTAAYRIAC